MPISTIAIAISTLFGDGLAAFFSLNLGQGNSEKAARGVGTAVIGREGDNYTIDFEFRDNTYKGIFRGSYTGPLAFYDGTAYGSGAASLQQAGTGARLLKSTGPRTLPASKRPLMRR